MRYEAILGFRARAPAGGLPRGITRPLRARLRPCMRQAILHVIEVRHRVRGQAEQRLARTLAL